MTGGSRFVAIGEQGLNSLAVAVNLGELGTLVGGLLAGLDGAAGGAGGSAKLGTKALAEACGAGGVSRVSHSKSCERARFCAAGAAMRRPRARRRPEAASACD